MRIHTNKGIPEMSPKDKARIIAYRLDGQPIKTIAQKYGVAPNTINKLLSEIMTPEQRKTAQRKSHSLGRVKGMAVWRLKTKGKLGRVKGYKPNPMVFDYCINLDSCTCPDCQKRKSGGGKVDQERQRVHKSWGVQAR